MNKKILGVILFTCFIIILATGLCMYLLHYNYIIASLHTLFGLILLIFILIHIFNNRKILVFYLHKSEGNKFFLFRPITVIILLTSVIVFGIMLNLSLFNSVYNFGNFIRSNTGNIVKDYNFQIIKENKSNGEYTAEIEVLKGKYFGHPLFAIWLEDSAGNYIRTIYISKSISSSVYKKGKKIARIWMSASLRRPEALPYWSHKRNILASDGMYVPLENSPDLDAISGATPTNSFIIKSKINSNCKILLEVNQSFDWNNYYKPGSHPEDKIYSGSGNVGQPALVYRIYLDNDMLKAKNHFFMDLIGHSHYSGADGKLYTDLSGITTAKEIIERIVVTTYRN